MARVALSKRTRFEIFKRDGFTCQYCGAQPPEVVLEVDHILPVANGGDNDPMNLVTSCFNCNRGKTDKQLERTAPRPDADLEWLASQQELAELRRYQVAKSERETVLKEIASQLQDTWFYAFNSKYAPGEQKLVKLMMQIPPEVIEKAIYIASDKKPGEYSEYQYRYMCGVCWNIVNEKEKPE